MDLQGFLIASPVKLHLWYLNGFLIKALPCSPTMYEKSRAIQHLGNKRKNSLHYMVPGTHEISNSFLYIGSESWNKFRAPPIC